MDVIVDTVDLKIKRLVLSRWKVNSYIVLCLQTGASAVIDTPPEASEINKNLEGTNPRYILLTHGHIDHIAGLNGVQNRIKAPLAIHQGDQPQLQVSANINLNDTAQLQVGKVKIKVIYTPGHTPGSVCFLVRDHLFAGDTLFPGGPGRTDSPEDFQLILKSISEKLFVLPDETQVYPGHGEFTTIGKEKGEYSVFSSHKHDPELCGDVSWLKS